MGTGLDIWLCGGGRLAGTLWPEIDELLIKTYPVVAGTGIPVWPALPDRVRADPPQHHQQLAELP
ncbi:hypothetical protein ACGFZB_25230 [Streptomyces cinerochromogenes]|uniref:Bacterial bifunctional deaminase-reductase C-terminal domain-containing protein n=1 Tax=Streptomyces cinerochromogenes TaxID=66422 RepID=A0ABW7BA06_9ACTN